MRKHRRKYKRIRFIRTLIILCAIFILGYIYFPRLLLLISKDGQKSAFINEYKKDLPKYSCFGIDVSKYQNDINWDDVVDKQDIDFAIIRATAGKDYYDIKFAKNWKDIEDHKLIKGAYHYYRPNENSTEQANFFTKHVKLNYGDLPPILDIEKYSRVQSLNKLKTGLLNWLNIVEKHYGVTPIIYTYNNFYVSTIANDKRFDKYPIWIAWYKLDANPNEILKDWIIWQFTDKGKVHGIEGDVDINVFNGDINKLDLLRIGY